MRATLVTVRATLAESKRRHKVSTLISTKSLFMCRDAVLQIMENVVLLIGTRIQYYSVQLTLLLEGDIVLDELQ